MYYVHVLIGLFFLVSQKGVDVSLGLFCSRSFDSESVAVWHCAQYFASKQTYKETARQSINRPKFDISMYISCMYVVYACPSPNVGLFFARTTHLAIAQLVERRTVVGNIKLTSLGRWFKSASRELFHFARTFLEKHLRPGRPKGMSSLLMQ